MYSMWLRMHGSLFGVLFLRRDLKTPFSKWNTEQVCDWIEDIGLGQYSILARQWVTSGQTLLSATPQDLEKVYTLKRTHHCFIEYGS